MAENETVNEPVSMDDMTPEQIDAELDKLRDEFKSDVPMDNDYEEESPEENTEETAKEVVESSEKPLETESPEFLKAELAKRDTMFQNLRSLHDKQIAELGELRKRGETYEKLNAALEQNPALAQNLFGILNGQPVQPQVADEPFEFADPNSVKALARQAFREEMQAIQQQNAQKTQQQYVQNWNTNYQSSATNLKVQGVDETALTTAIGKVTQMFKEGKIPELAWALESQQSAVDAAYKKGREEAIAGLKKASNEPKRAVGVTSRNNNINNNELKDMDTSQILAQIHKLPVGSPEWNALEARLKKIR